MMNEEDNNKEEEIKNNIVTFDGREFDKEEFIENQNHKRQALKLIFQMEDFEPTKVVLIGTNEEGSFVILSNHNSLADVNLMIDSAKERILNV